MLTGNRPNHVFSVSQWTAAREMRAQKIHLLGQHTLAFEVDIFRVCRCKGDREQFHIRLLRRSTSLMIIATFTGCYDVLPEIFPTVGDGRDVVSGQIRGDKSLAAVQANLRVSPEQRAVGQRRHVTVGQRLVGTVCGDDCVDFNFAALARVRVDSSPEFIDTFAKAIGHAV